MERTRLAIVSVLLLGSAALCYQWIAQDPEQTMYAFKTCVNKSMPPRDLFMKWFYWDLPDDATTNAYIICVLKTLMIVDPNGLDSARLYEQIEHAVSSDDGKSKLRSDMAACEKNGKDTVQTFKCILEQHKPSVIAGFYGSFDSIDEYFRNNPTGAKRQNQTVEEYCRLKLGYVESDQSLEYRNLFSAPQPTPFAECLLRHYRYVDQDWVLQPDRIVADLKAMDEQKEVDINVSTCLGTSPVTTAQGRTKAIEQFRCIFNQNPDAISKLLVQKNKRSYRY